MFGSCREPIAINNCAHVARRMPCEWIARKEPSDIRFALQQTDRRPSEPRILLVRSERSEPHLPIEPRLMRRAPAGGAHDVARFPFEFVRVPDRKSTRLNSSH